ncbi:hypothetical protein KP509_18G080000 [Ceratopteris richardii]|nr:hypothetical protein KP509_18G080000 [Ceratopteris richardii]
MHIGPQHFTKYLSGPSGRPATAQHYLKCLSCLGKFSTLDCLADQTDIPVKSLPINMNLKPQVVLYDGVCHLSNAGVHWLIKIDKEKRLSFCAVQSEVAKPYLQLCGLSQEDVLNRFLFVEGPGQFSQASTAALRMSMYLPFPYQVLSSLLIVLAPLRDSVYDYVARRRYKWFGRAKNYILPKEDVLDHFINRAEILSRYKQERGF